MNQIILNGILLPQTSFDRYACWEEVLTRQLDMISGRRVLERIGKKWKVWRVRWAYDYLEDETCRPVLAVLRSVYRLCTAGQRGRDGDRVLCGGVNHEPHVLDRQREPGCVARAGVHIERGVSP